MRQNRPQKFIRKRPSDDLDTIKIDNDRTLGQGDLDLITEKATSRFPANALLAFKHVFHFKNTNNSSYPG